MKKVVVLGLALVIALGTLVGCGSKETVTNGNKADEIIKTETDSNGVEHNYHEESVKEENEEKQVGSIARVETYYKTCTEDNQFFDFSLMNDDYTVILVDILNEEIRQALNAPTIDEVMNLGKEDTLLNTKIQFDVSFDSEGQVVSYEIKFAE